MRLQIYFVGIKKTSVRQRGRPSIEREQHTGTKVHMPHMNIRTDYVHWPIFDNSSTRCKYPECSTLTYVRC